MESAFIFGGNAGAAPVDGLSWANLPGGNAVAAWDFLTGEAVWSSAYIGALSNTPNWTFTRASTGYAQTSAGVLTAFASGELRRTDKGVLIEGARTNILTRSQEATTILSGSNCTLADDVTTAPDGTSTADSITEAATTSTHFAYHTAVNGTSTTTYSFSVFVKANGRNFVILNLQASANNYVSAVFNLATGAMTESSVGATSGTLTGTAITALANGWYRITLIGTATGALSFCIATAPAASGNAFTTLGLVSFLGSTSNSVYIWGWQVEAASFPSSYIPTTTASATRAADSLNVTGVTGLPGPYSLFAQVNLNNLASGGNVFFGVSDGTINNGAAIYQVGGAYVVLNKTGGSNDAIVIPAGTATTGALLKLAGRIETNNVNGRANGGALGTTDTSCTAQNVASIQFGSASVNTVQIWGYLERTAIWNRALTDAELQSVTT